MPLSEIVDYGNAPEFFVTDLGRCEIIGDYVRLYLCARRGGALVLQYTAVWPAAALIAASNAALLGALKSPDLDRRAHH